MDGGWPVSERGTQSEPDAHQPTGGSGGRPGILNDAMGVAATDVYVLIRENPAGNHYCGGTPLAPWVPADG